MFEQDAHGYYVFSDAQLEAFGELADKFGENGAIERVHVISQNYDFALDMHIAWLVSKNAILSA